MIRNIFFSASLLAVGAQAASIEIQGVGQVAMAPEYAKVSVTVNSQCYDTPVAAKTAVAQVLTAISSALDPFKDPKINNQLVVSQGNLQQRAIYDNNRNPPTELCAKNKWHSAGVLEFKILAPGTNASPVQEAILVALQNTTTQTEEAPIYPGVTAAISPFKGGVFDEARKTMRKQALELATRNAIAEVQVKLKACGFVGDVSLVKSTLPSDQYGRAMYSMSSESARDAGSNSSVPFAFPDIEETVIRNFYFEAPDFTVCRVTK